MNKQKALEITQSVNAPVVAAINAYLKDVLREANKGICYVNYNTAQPNIEALTELKDKYGYDIYIRKNKHGGINNCNGYPLYFISWSADDMIEEFKKGLISTETLIKL